MGWASVETSRPGTVEGHSRPAITGLLGLCASCPLFPASRPTSWLSVCVFSHSNFFVLQLSRRRAPPPGLSVSPAFWSHCHCYLFFCVPVPFPELEADGTSLSVTQKPQDQVFTPNSVRYNQREMAS